MLLLGMGMSVFDGPGIGSKGDTEMLALSYTKSGCGLGVVHSATSRYSFSHPQHMGRGAFGCGRTAKLSW